MILVTGSQNQLVEEALGGRELMNKPMVAENKHTMDPN